MKAVLAIDMPDCCNNCPCYDGMEDRSCCNVLNEDMRFASYGRLGNCPLRPMPKKKTEEEEMAKDPFNEDLFYDEYIWGWNACLDAITGETE